MGLDMYLKGKKFIWTNWKEPEKNPTMDGYRISEYELDLGYWRKHPNLHGYIVKNYGNGVDDCKEIYLDEDALRDIIDAVENDRLPHTEGFFFGSSKDADKEGDLKILRSALDWLLKAGPSPTHEPVAGLTEKLEEIGMCAHEIKYPDDASDSRDVVYRASW